LRFSALAELARSDAQAAGRCTFAGRSFRPPQTVKAGERAEEVGRYSTIRPRITYWQLAELEVKCEVVAPTLMPVLARVKTDRRDAKKLALLPIQLSDGGVGSGRRL
jgi:hypothetical protein